MKTILGGALSVLIVALAAGAASAQTNLVTNGDFETGNFTGWTINPTTNNPWSVTANSPTEGAFSASTGCVGAACTDQTNLATAAYLFQNIATVAGHAYTLTFDFTPNGGTENELKTLFGGNVVLDLVDTAYTPTLVTYTVSNLVATAGSTQLEFLGRQDPGFDRLDNVTVVDNGATSVSAAPEPGVWALMLGGLGMLGAFLRVQQARRREDEVRSIATA